MHFQKSEKKIICKGSKERLWPHGDQNPDFEVCDPQSAIRENGGIQKMENQFFP